MENETGKEIKSNSKVLLIYKDILLKNSFIMISLSSDRAGSTGKLKEAMPY
ncbi:MAG: hypothetical protein V7K89_17485 [Nostoc sp.]|uniref:hypothetical protein n=1 Tax=Nostoc sp. TaxID=1180 RepID=UPI002FF7CB29